MLTSVLPQEAPVFLDLEEDSEEGTIRAVAGLLAGDPGVGDFPRFVEAVLERQKINPPLLGNGIALPHARCAAVGEIVFAAARCLRPVMFGQTPVSLVFLFGVPPYRIADYLGMTAALARRLRDPGNVAALLEAGDEETFRRRIGGG